MSEWFETLTRLQVAYRAALATSDRRAIKVANEALWAYVRASNEKERPMWSERNLLDSLLWEAAVDDLGIYPRATVKDGVETLRTEWQDGWNAAVMAITKRHGQFTTWSNKALTDDQRAQVREMLDSDGEPVLLRYDEEAGVEGVRLALSCGDTFMYACSDAEDFTLADIPEIHRLWKAHGYPGLIAWIARKRQQEPVKEYRLSAFYLKAKADLS